MEDQQIGWIAAIIVGGFEPQAEVVNVCRLTGGEAFRADDPDALPSVFKKIDTMKQAKLTPTIVETVDYYEPAALLGGDHWTEFTTGAQLVQHIPDEGAHRAGHACMKAWILAQYRRQQGGTSAWQTGDEVIFLHGPRAY